MSGSAHYRSVYKYSQKSIGTMDKLKKAIAVMIMAMIAVYTTAQETVNTTNAATDIMKSNGKIYVVMTVVTIIVIGLLLYVMRVDRKISKLEKKG